MFSLKKKYTKIEMKLLYFITLQILLLNSC